MFGLTEVHERRGGLAACRQIPSISFKQHSEIFDRASKAFQEFQSPFRKFQFISRNPDLSMSYAANGPGKINDDGLTDIACWSRPFRPSFSSSFRVPPLCSSKRRAGAISESRIIQKIMVLGKTGALAAFVVQPPMSFGVARE
jgi:hypothetical protein